VTVHCIVTTTAPPAGNTGIATSAALVRFATGTVVEAGTGRIPQNGAVRRVRARIAHVRVKVTTSPVPRSGWRSNDLQSGANRGVGEGASEHGIHHDVGRRHAEAEARTGVPAGTVQPIC
jgi:hypothetical protein